MTNCHWPRAKKPTSLPTLAKDEFSETEDEAH